VVDAAHLAGNWPTAAGALGLTLVSGTGDAFGFVHAARVWRGNSIVGSELLLAVVGFAVGIASYIVVLRYLDQLGIRAPEVQSLAWFTVTIFGVAVIQRTWLAWSAADRVVAAIAVLSVGWLVVRRG
jgi:hypothetical protein